MHFLYRSETSTPVSDLPWPGPLVFPSTGEKRNICAVFIDFILSCWRNFFCFCLSLSELDEEGCFLMNVFASSCFFGAHSGLLLFKRLRQRNVSDLSVVGTEGKWEADAKSICWGWLLFLAQTHCPEYVHKWVGTNAVRGGRTSNYSIFVCVCVCVFAVQYAIVGG